MLAFACFGLDVRSEWMAEPGGEWIGGTYRYVYVVSNLAFATVSQTLSLNHQRKRGS